MQGDILEGKLVPVLTDWELPLLTMNIAYQNRVRLPAKIRVFFGFLGQPYPLEFRGGNLD